MLSGSYPRVTVCCCWIPWIFKQEKETELHRKFMPFSIKHILISRGEINFKSINVVSIIDVWIKGRRRKWRTERQKWRGKEGIFIFCYTRTGFCLSLYGSIWPDAWMKKIQVRAILCHSIRCRSTSRDFNETLSYEPLESSGSYEKLLTDRRR